jgi:hypothetical protein
MRNFVKRHSGLNGLTNPKSEVLNTDTKQKSKHREAENWTE